jgi:hypothetical protein
VLIQRAALDFDTPTHLVLRASIPLALTLAASLHASFQRSQLVAEHDILGDNILMSATARGERAYGQQD